MPDFSLPRGRARLLFVALLVSVSAHAGAEVSAALPNVHWQWLDDECEDRFKLRVPLTVGDKRETADQAWIAFNRDGEQRYYAANVAAGQVRLLKVVAGRATPIGRTRETADLRPGETVDVTLTRDPWRMSLTVGEVVVAHAYDADLAGGRVGLASSSPRLAFGEPAVQPLGEVYFTDDFMRAGGETGEWETIAGKWRTGSPEEGTRADPRLSANPFFYRVSGVEKRRAIAAAGHWFWDDYAVSAAVKLPAKGAAGLCAFVQDAERHVLFRIVSRQGGTVAQLAHMTAAGEALLAEADVDCRAGSWYKLTLVATSNGLRGMVDSEVVCKTDVAPIGQGRVGLYFEGDEAPGDLRFDDVHVASVADVLVGDLAAAPWQPAEKGSSSPAVGPVQVTGSSQWRDYQVSVEARPRPGEDLGLCFGHLAPDDFYVLRRHTNAWTDKTTWDLKRVAPTGVVTLVRRDMPEVENSAGRNDGWLKLSAEISGGHVLARVGDSLPLVAADDGLATGERAPGGRVGVLTDDDPANDYRDLAVSFRQPEPFAPEVTQQFTQEDTMSSWASPAGEWRAGEDGWVWRRGEYFRDCEFAFPLPNHAKPGRVEAIVCGDGLDPGKGYRLDTHIERGKPLVCELWRDGEAVARTEGIEWEPGDPLSLSRDEGLVQVALSGDSVLTYCDEDPLRGTKVGFRAHGIPTDTDVLKQPRYGTAPPPRKRNKLRDQLVNVVGNVMLGEVLGAKGRKVQSVLRHMSVKVDVDFAKILSRRQREEDKQKKAADPVLELGEVAIRSSRLYDCNFSSAPVDWRVADGDWQVTQRWTCSPQWTFFGGRGGKQPTLWSKRHFHGDQVVEFFASKPMAKQGPGNDRPRNFQLSLCGDGEDPNSGYVFTVAGDNGKANRLSKQGKELVSGPYRLSTNDPHRAWIHIRAERIGNRLRLVVDDEVIFTRDDPEPLAGGPLAFWSDPQGMMVARVRVWDSGPGT